MVRAITMALAITTARVTTIHPVITGVHLDTSITIILIGVTVTGGIIIGGTISEGPSQTKRDGRIQKKFAAVKDPARQSAGSLF